METNLEEANYVDIIATLNTAITKYEDGLLALQGLPLIESMQLDLNSAKELLFEGLKLLNIVYQYLKVPKIVEECVKVEIPEQIDHKIIISGTNSEIHKNFKCDMCNKTFKIERFWSRHMLRVHGDNIEKDEISYFDSKGVDSSQPKKIIFCL